MALSGWCRTMGKGIRTALELLRMIRFEHSVFALPFAVAAALRATGGEVWWGPFGWVLLAMISARTAAMAFNRIVDRKLDALNPRTADRALPKGRISPSTAWLLVFAAVGLFLLAAWRLRPLCLILAPFVLLILLGYSFTKRFTWLSHFILGLSLGLAPPGTWLGLRGTLAPFPLLLGGTVLLWVSGFDLIYACLDVGFDRKEGLSSVPARFGVPAALRLSTICHVLTLLGLGILGILEGFGWIYWTGMLPLAALLLWEHRLVRPDDLSRANVAFFNVNALFSIALMVLVVAETVAGEL